MKLQQQLDHVITLRLAAAEWSALLGAAHADARSISGYVRRLIRQALAEKKGDASTT